MRDGQLATRLGYEHQQGNPAQSAARWLGGTRPGAWVFARTLRHLDSAIARATRGRHSAPGLLAGLAVLTLTTTGRRSGTPRTSHLIATPFGGDLALIGTNFGQRSTPAWVLNLEADPACAVSYRGRTLPAIARPATTEEVDLVFARAGRLFSGYRDYRSRIGDRRRVRVFVLSQPTRHTKS